MPVSPLKRLLVLRRLQRFNGGVLKTLDYFCHARASGLVQARMLLLPPRPWDDALESYLSPHEVVTEPDDPDIVLLSREWDEADRLGLSSPERTFIHLVQHSDHVTEGSAEYGSLSRPAFRIVVSREYAKRISAYAHLNGGLTTIEAGVCVRREAIPWNSRRWDVTIAGLKNPQVAQAVAALLAAAGHSVRLLIDRLSRRDYLDYVAQARILIALPQQIGESVFLPALEGMHLDVVVVLPEIFGLGRYYINELTCLTTAYEAHDIANRTIELMRHTEKMNKLRRGGAEIASRLTIANERRRFTLYRRSDQIGCRCTQCFPYRAEHMNVRCSGNSSAVALWCASSTAIRPHSAWRSAALGNHARMLAAQSTRQCRRPARAAARERNNSTQQQHFHRARFTSRSGGRHTRSNSKAKLRVGKTGGWSSCNKSSRGATA
jgi:hypothetical protein